MMLESRHSSLLAGACLAVMSVLYGYQALTRPISRLPGPWYTKWTSLVKRYHWFFGQQSQYVHALHQKYGPVVRTSPYEVDICDAKAYKEIYTAREVFVKPDWYKILTGNVTETMFNTTDTNYHRRVRRLLSSPLSEASIVTNHGFVDSKARLVVERMKDEMNRKGWADVYKWWMFMATDVIGELTFGESFNMLEKDERDEYSMNVEGVGRAGATYTTFMPFHWVLRWLPIPLFKKTRRTTMKVLGYAEQSLDRHQRLVDQGIDEEEKPTLFTKIYKAQEAGEISFREIRDNSVSYIVAGSDTTALSLTYLVWAVLSNPAVKAELINEVQAMDENSSEMQLREAKYLNWTIDETLRLHGAAQSTLPRVVPPGGAMLCDHWFEGGTIVGCQAYSMHRDPAAFPEPLVFNPRRWENPTKEMKDSFCPFGGGARVCIGLHLARMEMRQAVFRFFRAFPKADIAAPEDDMEAQTYFVSCPKARRCLISVS